MSLQWLLIFYPPSSELKHVTIGLFEANNTNDVAVAMNLKQILNKFGLTQKIMAYVKDEGSNLVRGEPYIPLKLN
jgi:hypothetical protein